MTAADYPRSSWCCHGASIGRSRFVHPGLAFSCLHSLAFLLSTQTPHCLRYSRRGFYSLSVEGFCVGASSRGFANAPGCSQASLARVGGRSSENLIDRFFVPSFVLMAVHLQETMSDKVNADNGLCGNKITKQPAPPMDIFSISILCLSCLLLVSSFAAFTLIVLPLLSVPA